MLKMPGFYNFRAGGRGDPMVSMMMAAIPVLPADIGGGTAEPIAEVGDDLENLVLVYHLFLYERDPFCVIVPSRK